MSDYGSSPLNPVPQTGPAGIISPLNIEVRPPEEVSPWWLRGTAFLVITFSLLTLINAVVADLGMGFAIDSMQQLVDVGIGDYPENGTVDQQREWNETQEALVMLNSTRAMLEDPRMKRLIEVQQYSAIINILVGGLAAFLLFNQDRRGLIVTGVWLLVRLASQLYGVMVMPAIYDDHLAGLYEQDMAWMSSIQLYGGIVQWAFCGIVMAAILTIVWAATREQPTVAPSGFHSQNL